MEFLVAAALSDGHTGASNPMLELYRSGDPYTGFGKLIGYIPRDATREDPGVEAIRNRLKVLCLAVQYGMQTATLATRLGVSEIEAREMLLHHRGLFSQYWHWSEDWLHHSLDSGMMQTVFGWECATGIVEFNERSIRNFPVQATSADIFRLACVWGTRHGLTLIAPVHDAVLLESTDDRIEADVALMQEIMRRASSRDPQPDRRRHHRAAHRRQDHPASRPLHRRARRGAVEHGPEAAGRAARANGSRVRRGGRPWMTPYLGAVLRSVVRAPSAGWIYSTRRRSRLARCSRTSPCWPA